MVGASQAAHDRSGITGSQDVLRDVPAVGTGASKMTEDELKAIEASVATGNMIDPDRTQYDIRALIAEIRRLQTICADWGLPCDCHPDFDAAPANEARE